VDLYSALT